MRPSTLPSQRPEVQPPSLVGEVTLDADGHPLSVPAPLREFFLNGVSIEEALPELPWAVLSPEHAGAQISLLIVRGDRARDIVVETPGSRRLILRERDPLVAYGAVGESYMVVTERILAELAHDLNNPVTGVLAAIDTLLEFEVLSKDAIELVTGARTEVLRLAELTRRARTRVKHQPLALELTEVNVLLTNIAQPLLRDLSRRRLSVRVELPERPHLLRLDPVAIRTMVQTLLMNAMEAMERTGGEITLTGRVREAAGLSTFLEIEVSDRGPGMSPDELLRAGDLLFTTHRGGAGIGLLVLRRMATEHGGSISLRSVRGEGTRATLLVGAGASSTSSTVGDSETTSDSGATRRGG